MMSLLSTKVNRQWRCHNGEDSKGSIYRRIQGRGSKDGKILKSKLNFWKNLPIFILSVNQIKQAVG